MAFTMHVCYVFYHPYQAGSSLVIINLPDPPLVSMAEGADPKQLAALQLEQVSE